MSSIRASIGTALELARLSNAPTVVSNVLAGVALGGLASGVASPFAPWSAVVRVALACVALYAAGMALNDLLDRRIDARERPNRPLPSGRVQARTVLGATLLLLIAAIVLLATVSHLVALAGTALAALIVLYDATHTRGAWSVLLMGSCRGMVYVTASLVHGVPERPGIVLFPALILVIYVAAFSLVARREMTTESKHTRRVAGIWLVPLLWSATLAIPDSPLTQSLRSSLNVLVAAATATVGLLLGIALVKASLELRRRPPAVPAAITLWIAAIALFDAYLLVLTHSMPAASLAVACFVATRLAQRRIAGT